MSAGLQKNLNFLFHRMVEDVVFNSRYAIVIFCLCIIIFNNLKVIPSVAITFSVDEINVLFYNVVWHMFCCIKSKTTNFRIN